ncbi:energy-coupling factor ABC transporter ATP-binding protein [Corynebacterium anserum]|uniref:ATP-binding cassette domain-containing protein n=1 Tax=Corynebacterium anserum TaxID=2684406 RepID=A0A7G7YNR1_9CORY|nr:ABC transporter ATP-binding protein [Corynebacterium anserum]MBC2681721.1 ATP-binding cassette domain-containing protein [Corynebacterium anserum]QNH96131.1 ATP-binding cassette domain-containing protein [Corynebacterium anserum]
MPTITFSDASLRIGQRTILEQFSLSLSEHRIGIIGANGSGKSTMAHMINGLISPSSGTVCVDNLNVETQGKEVRNRVGFIFSDADNQIIMPTVEEDVAFSLRRRKLSRAQRNEKVHHALNTMGLADRKEQSPHQLSGGEKQLLALASITVLEPELIIADEPTTLLDLRNRKKVARMLHSLPQQMIIVTHDLNLLTDVDRVICLDEGRIVDDSADPRLPSPSPRAVIDAYVERM